MMQAEIPDLDAPSDKESGQRSHGRNVADADVSYVGASGHGGGEKNKYWLSPCVAANANLLRFFSS